MASFEGGNPNIGGGANAQGKVNGPALALLITAALGMLFSLYTIAMGFINIVSPPPPVPPQVQKDLAAKGFDVQAFQNYAQAGGGAGNVALGIVELIAGAVIILGATKMRSLQSYGLAMTASILAMVPCVSPCCCITLPFGIWALVVLLNADVKAAFR